MAESRGSVWSCSESPIGLRKDVLTDVGKNVLTDVYADVYTESRSSLDAFKSKISPQTREGFGGAAPPRYSPGNLLQIRP